MITEHDLQEAIAECEGVRNPSANTCIKLAAFYTIRQHLFEKPPEHQEYSYAPYPSAQDRVQEPDFVSRDGESEFSQAINGMDISDVLDIVDELMDTLKIINPRLYAGVMRKIAG